MQDDDESKLSKHTLNLYKGDYNKLRQLYPDIGAGAVIRRIIRNYIDRIESGHQPNDINTEIKL